MYNKKEILKIIDQQIKLIDEESFNEIKLMKIRQFRKNYRKINKLIINLKKISTDTNIKIEKLNFSFLFILIRHIILYVLCAIILITISFGYGLSRKYSNTATYMKKMQPHEEVIVWITLVIMIIFSIILLIIYIDDKFGLFKINYKRTPKIIKYKSFLNHLKEYVKNNRNIFK